MTELKANDYHDLDHLRANIEDFIERYDMGLRPA